MTLLDSIASAAAAASTGSLSPPHSNFPIISSSHQIIPNLRPAAADPDTVTESGPPVRPASAWRPPDVDSAINALLNDLCLGLKSKLKKPKSFRKNGFFSLVNSFFRECSSLLQVQIDSNPGAPNHNFTFEGLEKLGVLISREVGGLIAEGCVLFKIWDLLENVLVKNLVGNLNSFNLVEKLAEKNRPELVCLCLRTVSNLRASEIRAAMKLFLSLTEDSYAGMVRVKKEWEREALLAIERVKEVGLPKKVANLAKDAVILLMMAYDGFYASEICLHYVFGSKSFDGLVLASAVARLDGVEVVGLFRYFLKWLKKYERFPQARPCPSAGAVLGLTNCESVPSLEAVVKGLKLVLDEHFSYLVLNTKIHDELRKVENVVGLLVLEAELCRPLDDVVKRLRKLKNHEDLEQ